MIELDREKFPRKKERERDRFSSPFFLLGKVAALLDSFVGIKEEGT